MGITNTIAKLKSYFEAWHNAEKSSHIELIYPVGSIYMSVNDTNPASLFGGNWEKIEGRFLLGSGHAPENNNKEYRISDTGGSKNAIIPQHNHTQQPHTHTQVKHKHNNASVSNGYRFLLSDGDIKVNWTPRGAVKQTETGDWHYVYSKVTSGNLGDIIESDHTEWATPTNNDATAINNQVGEPTEDKNMPPYLVVHIWKRIG